MYCCTQEEEEDILTPQEKNILDRVNESIEKSKKKLDNLAASENHKTILLRQIHDAEVKVKNALAFASEPNERSQLFKIFGDVMVKINKEMNYFENFLYKHHQICDKVSFFRNQKQSRMTHDEDLEWDSDSTAINKGFFQTVLNSLCF